MYWSSSDLHWPACCKRAVAAQGTQPRRNPIIVGDEANETASWRCATVRKDSSNGFVEVFEKAKTASQRCFAQGKESSNGVLEVFEEAETASWRCFTLRKGSGDDLGKLSGSGRSDRRSRKGGRRVRQEGGNMEQHLRPFHTILCRHQQQSKSPRSKRKGQLACLNLEELRETK